MSLQMEGEMKNQCEDKYYDVDFSEDPDTGNLMHVFTIEAPQTLENFEFLLDATELSANSRYAYCAISIKGIS